MIKKSLNLTISEDLIRKGREYNINFSSFLEMKLVEYIAYREGIYLKNIKPDNMPSNKNKVRRGGDLNSRGDKSPRALQARAVPGWATSA